MKKKLFIISLTLSFIGNMFAQSSIDNSYNDLEEKDTTKKVEPRLLDEVAITISKEPDRKSDYVARIPIKNMENPQVYTVIPRAIMEQQVATSYADAFKNIPGTEVPAMATNGRMDISSRGFKVRSQIVDGISGYTMTTIDPANIEMIEVVRGPSATLFGSSLTSYGGLINIVTKQPYRYFGGNVSYYLGSFGSNRLTVDVNTPLNKKRTLNFRINAAGDLGKTHQDAGFHKTAFVAPSLSYKPTERITLTANFEYYARRATSPFWFVPSKKTEILDVRDLAIDKTRSFASDDVFYTTQQFNTRVRADIELSKTWTSSTIFSSTKNDLDGQMLSLKGISDSTLIHNVNAGPRTYSTIEVQQNFLNDYSFGKFRNRFLVGIDFYQYNSESSSASVNVDTTNFTRKNDTYNTFTKAQVDHALKSADYNHTSSKQNTYSAYISDVFSFNKRFFLMVGLRIDRFENKGDYNFDKASTNGRYNQTAFSPKVGLVYQPIKDKLSIFGNYMNGFQNVNGTDFQGNVFKPQQANQWEAGVKLSLLKGKMFSTISAYRILVDNMLRTDFENPEFSVQDGTQLSKGVEMTLNYNPFSGFNIIAGYSYNYAVYLKAKEGLEGRRPDGAGPQHTANLWMSYDLRKTALKGLGIGIGGRYGSNVTTIKSFAQPYYIPQYTVLDATVYYERDFYRVSFKVNNITNETYWTNRLTWQEPISFIVGVSVNLAKLNKVIRK